MFSLLLSLAHPQTMIVPRAGLTISSSAAIRKGVYTLPSSVNLASPAMKIQGKNLVLDFSGVILQGTPQMTEPDQRKGLGVLVSGSNITIKNLKVRGYKVGLMAKNVPGLKIENCDFSYNWKQQLKSTPEKEDLSDWMSYHQNEKDEWLQYGAGIYLRDCDKFSVRGSRATGGQCGLMITNCNDGTVISNDFSFLSGIGLGMYRSSGNRIMHNKIDWCVRGYSHGVYNRGQDSAGILIYEQSNKNVFAYNSVTHGGDGFFLWAGQTTMDTGKGGCNDNLVYGNDFSNAATNGIEATFSRNKFVNNLIENCWHGVWGGYSYDSLISANVFSGNQVAIAIEHGQNNTIEMNDFLGGGLPIQIWQNPSQDPNWAYPKHRDTKSHGYRIAGNDIYSGTSGVATLRDTTDVTIQQNTIIGSPKVVKTGEVGLEYSQNTIYAKDADVPDEVASTNIVRGPAVQTIVRTWQAYFGPGAPVVSLGDSGFAKQFIHLQPKAEPKALIPSGNTGSDMSYPNRYRGKENIIIDQWGPYDFRAPKIVARAGKLAILGPAGKWRIVSKWGVAKVSSASGAVPGSVKVDWTPEAGRKEIVLEYVGRATTDYRGIETPAHRPVRFSYSVERPIGIDWTVRFYKWSKPSVASEAHSLPDEDELQAVLKREPLKELKLQTLDFSGYSFDKVTGNDHFLTTAEGNFRCSAGTYDLEMTCDDGARVWLDGKLLIADAWHYQGPTPYARTVRLSEGAHILRVEHFQIDGFAALKVELRKGRTR